MGFASDQTRRWLVLALTVTAQFMVILDVAVVVVALPEIKNDLGFSQEGVQWVVTAYSILFAGTLLLGGRLADLLGRRRVFAAGVAVFAIGSLLSGIAWSEAALVGARALQGFGGALLSPAALSIIITTFPEGRERNRALGIWGGAAAAGGSAGVLLGGLLTELRRMAVDLLHQPARGHRHARRDAVPARGEPRLPHASPLRRRRRRDRHRRSDDARLRPRIRRRARVGRLADDRACSPRPPCSWPRSS